MTKPTTQDLKKVKENLGLIVRNRVVFVTTALNLAKERTLTKEESEKAIEHVNSVIKAVDAELLILILRLEQQGEL
ncbi:MAG TPA: hypothetical protein VD998_03005 [Verrucomicrobiae bacterium]|nr:hypothetical protein [Verrucomicrobiae bacterium]